MKSTRRTILTQTATAAGMLATGGLTGTAAHAADSNSADGKAPNFRYCLNTSTIRGQKLPIDKEVQLIAEAGYTGIEPWIREIRQYKESGGKLTDLRKQIADAGLQVESAIGFANWIVDDDEKRKQGLEALRRDMDLLEQIGGTRIAAPPVGATDKSVNLDRAAERYAAALKVGKDAGVIPLIELWGFSQSLHRLGELMYVAVECADKDAALLLDVYHIYKGGSDFTGLNLVDGTAVKVLHMNDYPDIPRDKIGDADRVYCGDGVAPIPTILETMAKTGFDGVLSLELFNRDYWKDDVKKVLARGLESMKSVVGQVS